MGPILLCYILPVEMILGNNFDVFIQKNSADLKLF